MIQQVKAMVDAEGRVLLLGELRVGGPRQALLVVFDEPPSDDTWPGEAALLAEHALAEDWLRPEEEAAWSHLQPEK